MQEREQRSPPEFVGPERHALVRELRARFETCCSETVGHLVVLEAEAGWGKTRVVQELYHELQAERQGARPYWPPSMVVRDGSHDPMVRRKIVNPEAPPLPDAEMPWLWWGLRCEGGMRLGRRAIFNDGVLLRHHLDGLLTVARGREADRELMIDVLGEVLGALPAVGSLAGAAHTVATLGPKLRDRFLAALRRGSRSATAEQLDGTGVAQRETAAEVAMVARFVGPDLPFLLVVDDAHEADPSVVDFVRSILVLRAPILVVATGWPSELADQAEAEQEVPLEERRTFGGLVEGVRRARPDLVSERALHPLRADDLTAVVRAVAPATSADRCTALVAASDGNPLALHLQLSTPKVVGSIVDDAITLAPAALGSLPRRFETLIASRFDGLPVAEQRWLAEAAWQGAIAFPDLFTVPWEGLDQDRLAGFVRPGEGAPGLACVRFIEAPVLAATRSILERDFSDEDEAVWTDHTAAVMAEWWADPETSLPEAADELAALTELVLRLADERDLPPPIVLSSALLLSFTRRDQERHDDEAAAAIVALRWADETGRVEDRLEALLRCGWAEMAVRRPPEAVAHFTEAAGLIPRAPNVTLTRQMDALLGLAQALAQTGEGLAAARRALDRAEALADETWMVRVLRGRSRVEREFGNDREAIAALDEVLTRLRSREPLDVETIIDVESDRLDLDANFGSTGRWRNLLAEAEQHLGDEHWLTDYCRSSLALALMMEGQIDEMRAVVDTLPADRRDPFQRFLSGMDDGDMSSALTWLTEQEAMPFSTARDDAQLQGMQEAARAMIDGTAGVSSPVAVLLARVYEGDADAVVELASHLWSDVTMDPMARMSVIGAWSGALVDLVVLGVQVPDLPGLVDGFRPEVARPDFPPLLRASFVVLEDLAAILRGEDRPPAAVGPLYEGTVLGMRALACRTVALWWVEDPRFEAAVDELVRRASAPGVPFMWRLAAAAALSSCEHPRRVEAWQAAVAAAPSDEDKVSTLYSLGVAFYAQGEYDRAIEVEREAVTLARSRLAADAVARVAVSLATSLERRGRPEDLVEAEQLRREAAAHVGDGTEPEGEPA